MIQSESHIIDKGEYKLHFKRIFTQSKGEAIMLVHGSIEDGKIFYSKSGKGLAPFLATHGFDVFVIDLRGKGKSTPAIDASANFGQHEAIMEDMPDFIEAIKSSTGNPPAYIGAHSWGGVISLSYLARFQHKWLKGIFFFGSKRDVKVQNINRWINIDLFWNKLGTYLVNKYGFLPAVKYKVGSDNESKKFFLQVNKWVYSNDWIDPIDNFNYGKALKEMELPPLFSITGSKDTHAGHPKDVKRLIEEVGNQKNHTFKIIGKKEGNLHDYNHINLLTHPSAVTDHFQQLLNWLNTHQ